VLFGAVVAAAVAASYDDLRTADCGCSHRKRDATLPTACSTDEDFLDDEPLALLHAEYAEPTSKLGDGLLCSNMAIVSATECRFSGDTGDIISMNFSSSSSSSSSSWKAAYAGFGADGDGDALTLRDETFHEGVEMGVGTGAATATEQTVVLHRTGGEVDRRERVGSRGSRHGLAVGGPGGR
jgi:hypothetical protein